VWEVHRLLDIGAGDVAEPARRVVELLKEQLPRCRDAVLAHDQVDLRAVWIQQPGSEGRLRGLADAEVAGEAALRADHVTRDPLERSLNCRES